MLFTFNYKGKTAHFNSSEGISIGMVLVPNGINATCYFANQPKAQIIRSGDWVGSVAEGGTVNYQTITFTPHGNGTHTECVGHITAEPNHTISNALKETLVLAQLASFEPEENGDDAVISLNQIKELALEENNVKALVIRSLPNHSEKEFKQYSNTNPPYLEAEVGAYLAGLGIEHLVVDLPSVDKEVDGGALSVHKGFWQLGGKARTLATITELIYVPDAVTDGLYMLQLGVPLWASDAAPSNLILYPITID
jgi:kynurenine formamidase